MNTHTYFLSTKARVIVAGALAASGALVFVLGVIVGLSIELPAVKPINVTIPGTSITTTVGGTPIASTGSVGSAGLPTATPTGAAWPFSAPGAVAEPAPTEPSADPAAAPAKPKADSAAAPKHRATVSDAAYVAPEEAPHASADDSRRFTVQVGMFRVEQNAHALADRLRSAGYKPVVSVRTEGDRSLHVVSVGGYTGRRAAIFAAMSIGDREHLVASPVPARGGR